MPQLDVVTFFSQFFWLCIFYIGFYYILYKYFLPSYSLCILFRDKFTLSSSIQKNANLEEKTNIEESLSLFRNQGVMFSKNFFLESKNNTEKWQTFTAKQTNEATWKTANLLYIKSFGAKIAKKNLGANCLSITCGDGLYLVGLSRTCKNYRLFFSQQTKEIPLLDGTKSKKKEEKEAFGGVSEKIKQKASKPSKPSQKKVSRPVTKNSTK